MTRFVAVGVDDEINCEMLVVETAWRPPGSLAHPSILHTARHDESDVVVTKPNYERKKIKK